MGSEMCIRDSLGIAPDESARLEGAAVCDTEAADEETADLESHHRRQGQREDGRRLEEAEEVQKEESRSLEPDEGAVLIQLVAAEGSRTLPVLGRSSLESVSEEGDGDVELRGEIARGAGWS